MIVQSLLIAASLATTAVTPEMLDRAYSNDMATASGRVRWHGKVTETVATTETNAQGVVLAVLTDTHEDGWTFRRESKAVSPTDSVRRNAALAARRIALQTRTNGLPVRLAAAIARRNDELLTPPIVTNITVTVGNPVPPETKDSDK